MRLADIRLPEHVVRALGDFRSGLDHRFGDRVRDVRLFGSRARGEAREDSDVDVLVVLDQVSRDDFVAITDLAADVFAANGAMIDPRIRSLADYERHRRQERPLVKEIERDGVTL